MLSAKNLTFFIASYLHFLPLEKQKGVFHKTFMAFQKLRTFKRSNAIYKIRLQYR